MSRDLPAMDLSQRLSDPQAYLRLQKGRRQALEALMAVEPDGQRLERVVDLICMIVEESSWAENPKGTPFDDDQHPRIDFQCAETLMLLAWVQRAMGERLGVRVSAKLQYEARRRVFSPFLAHSDYPFMRFIGPAGALSDRPLCILSDLWLASILLETDAGRRAAVMKQSLRLIDQAVQARDRRTQSLTDALAETAAVTDLCSLLRKLTRGQLDLTEVYPTADWLDALLVPWIDGGYFVDAATGDMRPGLSGQELFLAIDLDRVFLIAFHNAVHKVVLCGFCIEVCGVEDFNISTIVRVEKTRVGAAEIDEIVLGDTYVADHIVALKELQDHVS
jgi:hypothetical protein